MAKKILIIDDRQDILETMSERLTLENYQVETTNDSRKGLEMIKTGSYDIVLQDVQMPELSGLDVVESLEGTSYLKTTKLIIMTASEIPGSDLTELMKKGVAAWVRKPVDMNFLLQRLKTI